MFVSKNAISENKLQITANAPRSQSHKKSISTIPKESKERIIEIEETPMDSKKYFEKSLQLDLIKNNYISNSDMNNIQSNRIKNKLDNNRNINPMSLRDRNKMIKIEENFTSESESLNMNYDLNKDFVYQKTHAKTKHNFSGSFSKSVNSGSNKQIFLMNNSYKFINYSKKNENKYKFKDEFNYMRNKIVNYDSIHSKINNFSSPKNNNNSLLKKENNTITSKISNIVNTNNNNNTFFDNDKNDSANMSFSYFNKTNSDINTVNISKDIANNNGINKDQVNMIFYFNNYILTNQSKGTNEDNSVINENRNNDNLFFSDFDENKLKSNQKLSSFINIKNKEVGSKKLNKPSNSFRRNFSIKNLDSDNKIKTDNLNNMKNSNETIKNKYNFPNKINSNKQILNSLAEKRKLTKYTPTKSNNISITNNFMTEESLKLYSEANIRRNSQENSRLYDIATKNRNLSILNSIEDFNSFALDKKDNMQPQQLENSILFDLVSKYSGVSIKMIDYKLVKKQKYIIKDKSKILIYNIK